MQAFPTTCLNAHNMPTLLGITPREVEAACAHAKDLLVSRVLDR